MIYFDHNATTPLSAPARAAWLHAVDAFPGNPSSPHRLGARADAALQDARQTLARTLGCNALDIVWTSGASESSNTVFRHFAAKLAPGTPVWVSCIEHPCVLTAARRCLGQQLRFIPVDRAGVVDLEWLKTEFRGTRPGLVAVMAVNNETGVMQPWREVLSLCRHWDVPLFCDAAQWIGKLPAAGLGECDFLGASAHKFGGPHGVGFLKCPRHGLVEGLIAGGPQEDGRRAGTENVAGVLAMLAALTDCENALAHHEQEQRGTWRANFERELLAGLPGTEIIGIGAPRLWNTVSALMPEADCPQRWVVKLDKAGFAVSTGSACSSGKEAPSHVVTSMGYSPAEAARVLRFSSGWETTPEDWHHLVVALAKIYGQGKRKP